MKKFSVIILCLSIFCTLRAQNVADGLVAHFTFDAYPITDKSGNTNKAIIGGDSTLACGVEGSALRFDGVRNEVLFIGPGVTDNFKTADFSISFYFKMGRVSGTSTFDILSKRLNCNSDSIFAIRYAPAQNQLSVDISESTRFRHTMIQRLDFNRCWQHIVVVRNFNRVLLYVNGRLAQVSSSTKRVNITNNAPLAIAKSPCLATTDRKFLGFLDELRIYDRAITEQEVALLYSAPDRIANRDSVIFLGAKVPVRVTNTCATEFQWTPTEGVSDPRSSTPEITPPRGGVFQYILAMKEQSCTAFDTLELRVVDPKDLECTKVYLPKAFTPNTDGLNEQFYISNPYAIEELVSFEVFDRWGGRVFSTADRFGKWDGTFNGTALNPDVFLWRVRYRCKGQEISDFGSVTLLK